MISSLLRKLLATLEQRVRYDMFSHRTEDPLKIALLLQRKFKGKGQEDSKQLPTAVTFYITQNVDQQCMLQLQRDRKAESYLLLLPISMYRIVAIALWNILIQILWASIRYCL